MNWLETIRRWRQLSESTRDAVRWQRVPRQVALSMAFEREPVDEKWLAALHARRFLPPANHARLT